MSFATDVADWLLRNGFPSTINERHVVVSPHKDHRIAEPTLVWDHNEGYSYSEYTSEDASDSVRVTGTCTCGEELNIYYTFTGSDLIDFLNGVSQ